MAIETINYTVYASRIEPNTKQFGGVQGDHNKVEVVFTIDELLWKQLEPDAKELKLRYRFDLYNGGGEMLNGDPELLNGNEVSILVNEWLTRYGGVAKIVLVITKLENNTTHLQLHSFPVNLRFESLPTGSKSDGESHESITTLAEVAKYAADRAVNARKVAEDAADKVAKTNDVLKNGAVVIFDGNRGTGRTNVLDTIIDDVLENSKSAISSGGVYNESQEIRKLIESSLAAVRKEILSEAHPVGSLYWSEYITNPKILFGGEWERITGRFILAASNSDIPGTQGGDSTVTLEEKHIAPHQHAGLYYSNREKLVNLYSASGDEGVCISFRQDSVYAANDLKTGVNRAVAEPVNIMPPYEVYYCWKRTK